ncbi:zinc permease [Caloranaerobacter azorensis H53214]|uniref:Zinc permease n=1 Tax=Caloranaerobacter azorensis H53214 TaxID=1156417 RepID=A0A096BGG4_9FIRM|nr:ZIP family metal transporter [Caloranaerobacter azorensis]KGG79848.1 zinc permease [Caloranaerobacter azorensis H53214]
MSNIFTLTLIGSLVGITGTGLGGLIALSIVRADNKFLSSLLGFTSGLMLAVVTFDLLPESFSVGGFFTGIVGILLGVLTVIIIEDFIPVFYKTYQKTNKNDFLKTGIILGIGIAIHNLPEGLAVGSSFMFTTQMGFNIALVIALHNIPEGMAMATPLKISGMPKTKVLLLTLLSGIPTGIGAFIGAALGNISNFFISLCLAFAGGTMLYITCGELIPNAKKLYNGRASTIGLTIGLIIGIFMTTVNH